MKNKTDFMPTTIEIEITPITEAKEAILEAIKEYFLKGLDEKFIAEQIAEDLEDYIAEFKQDIFCLIEYPYVDKVYRDSYYNYYSSKHYSYQRDCIRVSLFESNIDPKEFLNPTLHEELNNKYLGYFTIRPTTSALFGRSIINPRAFEENEFKICACKTTSLVFGAKLETNGFPHSSQDEETIKCAETTIWALMEYFGNKYPEYRPTLPSKIHEALERFSFQRQLPSNGLTMDQISFALKTFGFGTRVYSTLSYGEEIYNIIDSYVESGIPVIVGLQSEDVGHVIIAVGKNDEADIVWNDVAQTEIVAWGRDVKFYDASSIPAKYIVQDDNMVPYRSISLDNPGQHYAGDEDCENYKIDSIVVPLYPKIYLEAVVSKELMLQIITDKTLGYDFGDDFVIRFYLASSRSFKNHIANMIEMNEVIKNNILITKMPKFIWCAEFYTKEAYEVTEKQAVGLVILDATEANNQSVDAFIFAGYSDRCIGMNENNYVVLNHKFEKYKYYRNLK